MIQEIYAFFQIIMAISLFLIHWLLRKTYYDPGNLCIFSNYNGHILISYSLVIKKNLLWSRKFMHFFKDLLSDWASWCSSNTVDSYSGCVQVKSWPRYWLSWFVFCGFMQVMRAEPGYTLIGHTCFLQDPFPCIINLILPSCGIMPEVLSLF